MKTQNITLAIAGNPNSGKTTLFNHLTGLRQKVANYPGITVEKKTGLLRRHGRDIELIDLPGIYGLTPYSEEERVASNIIKGIHPNVDPIHGLICVVDSTCLERSLYLVLQALEAKIPTMVLLNMTDELERRGAVIDYEQLSNELGAPVFPIQASKGKGLEAVFNQLDKWTRTPLPTIPQRPDPDPSSDRVASLRKKAKQICINVLTKKIEPHPWSDKIDKVVMHRLWGPLIFAAVVMVVFQSIFSWATPFMDLIDAGVRTTGVLMTRFLPDTLLTDFLVEGLIAGVGSVIIFLPQILIVFFFIAILEQSGYMARAAMVMDRFFHRVGLQGKSFLPLISSYACAVPGIMSARTIENKRDRMATILIAPFMTCSARLPVYALFIGAFVPQKILFPGFLSLQSLTLLGLYVAGFVAAIATSLLLKSSVLKPTVTPFFLDIPPYRLPHAKTILLLMWDRSKIFIRRASTIILGTTIVLWILASFPQPHSDANIDNSYAAKIGKFIEPVIRPLGFDWKIGVGLIAAQSAREVFISALSTIHSIELEEEEGDSKLREILKRDITPLTAVSLMVFFVFAMQCMSTIAIAKRETGGWKIPIIMFVYMNIYAYLGSLLVFQTGRLLGFS